MFIPLVVSYAKHIIGVSAMEDGITMWESNAFARLLQQNKAKGVFDHLQTNGFGLFVFAEIPSASFEQVFY